LYFKYGLGVSLLERIMTKAPYYGRILDEDDEEDELGEYNPLLLTKLLKNYRSHPAILEVGRTEFCTETPARSTRPFE
jgi:hypothetical protein